MVAPLESTARSAARVSCGQTLSDGQRPFGTQPFEVQSITIGCTNVDRTHRKARTVPAHRQSHALVGTSRTLRLVLSDDRRSRMHLSC